jgi:hypothetical protein
MEEDARQGHKALRMMPDHFTSWAHDKFRVLELSPVRDLSCHDSVKRDERSRLFLGVSSL